MRHLTRTLLLALTCAGAAHAQTTTTMSAAEYGADRDRIRAEYKAAKAQCDRLSGNAEDICEAEAKGKEKVALAELQHRRGGSAADARKLTEARADAAYDVAKERCDDMKGNERDVCVKEAKAAQARTRADATAAAAPSAVSPRARRDAAEERRDADYNVAVERCDSLAGAAKDDCIAAAKARFGRS